MYIEAYNNSTNTLIEKRKKFNEQLQSLFSSANDASSNKDWKKEFATITNFIEEFPKEQQQELFLFVCSQYLTTRSSSTYGYHGPTDHYKKALATSNTDFLRFVQNPKFKEYADTILQNIFKNEIYKVIDAAMGEESLYEAKQFIDLFLLDENKHLQHLNSYQTLNTILHNNRRHSLNFLIDQFNGWEKYDYLSEVLSKTSLDDHLLDKFLPKSGLISNPNLIQIVLNRDLPIIRKVEIVNQIVDFAQLPSNVINFYNYNISQNNITINKLESINDKFIEKIKESDYIKTWIKSDIRSFFANMDNILRTNLIPKDTLKEAVYLYMENLETNDLQNEGTFLTLMSKVNLDFNNPRTQKILINLHNIGKSNIDQLLISNENIIDCNVSLKSEYENFKYASINEYLKEKDSFIYNIRNFTNFKNEKKADAYEKILTQLNGLDYSYHNVLSPEHIKSLYEYAKNSSSGYDFFDKHFIHVDFQHNHLKKALIDGYLDYFKKETAPLVFDLPDDNPIHKFLNAHSVNNVFDNTYRDLLIKLNNYFHHNLKYTKNKDGVTAVAYAEKLHCGYLNELFPEPTSAASKAKSKKGFFKWFGHDEEPVQIVRKLNECELITDVNKKVAASDSSTNTSNNVVTSNTNSFEGLIQQANLDLNNLHKLLDQHADKNLNIEVKIRAENILLNNLNFLNTIKDSNEDLSFEDMHFLKSNLNKYLFQSISVYAKSVSRYEALSDPSNKLNTKSEEELERQKEKIDTEALKQIGLLEKELELVKEHIVHQINRDLLTDMKVTTRVLEHRVEESEGRSSPDEGRVIQIRKT